MNKLSLVAKGIIMGMVEAIPGVSGGTIALITGIYEELLNTIKQITPANLSKIFKDRTDFWRSINGSFLVFLLMGMAMGLIFGVLVISHLLDTQKEVLWAFFFGIVLASCFYLSRGLRWDSAAVFAALAGAAISFGITTFVPASGTDHPAYIFMAGCLAVSALMLPGISGSFILLLLGLYDVVIHAVKDIVTNMAFGKNLIILGIFSAGLLVGMFSFARVISYFFKKSYNLTMTVMIGILAGSLNKLWPWKLILSVMDKDTGLTRDVREVVLQDADQFKIIREANILPWQYAEYEDPNTWGIVLAFVLGIGVVILLSRYEGERT